MFYFLYVYVLNTFLESIVLNTCLKIKKKNILCLKNDV